MSQDNLGSVLPKTSTFEDNYKKDLSQWVEVKNGLKYLKWGIAIKELRIIHPTTTWTFLPETWYPDGSVMVTVNLIIDNVTHECSLPVMKQERGKRIDAHLKPNAFDINTTRQRCLVKAIAQATGIGLALYTNEEFYPDVPTLIEKIRYLPPTTDFKELIKDVWYDLTEADQALITTEVNLRKEVTEDGNK